MIKVLGIISFLILSITHQALASQHQSPDPLFDVRLHREPVSPVEVIVVPSSNPSINNPSSQQPYSYQSLQPARRPSHEDLTNISLNTPQAQAPNNQNDTQECALCPRRCPEPVKYTLMLTVLGGLGYLIYYLIHAPS